MPITLQNLSEKLKAPFHKMGKESEPDAKIYNSNNAISAKNAYMKSKYGRTLSQKDILSKFFGFVNETIQRKSEVGDYYCILEIDCDIREYIPQVITHFRDRLGYNIAIIDKHTKIINGDEVTRLTPKSAFMILTWNTPDISETIFEHQQKSFEPSSLAENDYCPVIIDEHIAD